MKEDQGIPHQARHAATGTILALGLAVLLTLTSCQISLRPVVAPAPAAEPKPAAGIGTNASAGGPAQSQAPAQPQVYSAVLQLTPSHAPVGASVQVTGRGYRPGANVDLVWYTVAGHYELQNQTEFVGQRYQERAQVLTTVRADESGSIKTTIQVPVGFGGPHDLRGRVDGKEVSQAGLMVEPVLSLTPREGPVGTPIELKIVGVDLRTNLNTWHVLYDNKYVGFVSAVTTNGIATAHFRAAGPVGDHVIAAWNNSYNPTPYLAWDTSPFKDIPGPGTEFTFRVTSDPGPAAPQVEPYSPTDMPWPSNTRGPAKLTLSVNQGTVGQPIELRGSGLPANTTLALRWSTQVGDRVSGRGFTEEMRPLGTVTTGQDGTFQKDLTIPDDLGGQHRIEVVNGDQILGTTGLVIEPSFVSMSPTRVHAGEQVTIHLKGVGWTTYDNTYTVTYDDAYIGYVCGFSTNGDVQFRITATGGPGTHIIDFYPTIYKGQDLTPRVYSMPQLSYRDDHPQRLTPAIHLAIEVVE